MASGLVSWPLFAVALCFLLLSHTAVAVIFTVDKTECITEEVQYDGDQISGSFVLFEMDEDAYSWGTTGMDLVVTGPNDQNVYSVHHRTDEEFSFQAPVRGTYKFCFTNRSPVAESVVFEVHVGHIPSAADSDVAKAADFNPLVAQVHKIKESLNSIILDTNHLRSRDIRHTKTLESTRRRLSWYALFETCVIVGCSLLQVYILQRLFEKRIGYNRF